MNANTHLVVGSQCVDVRLVVGQVQGERGARVRRPVADAALHAAVVHPHVAVAAGTQQQLAVVVELCTAAADSRR